MVEAGNQFRRVNATCTYVPCASPSSSTSRPPMSGPPPTITPSTPSNDQRSATEVDERRTVLTVLTVRELDWILGMFTPSTRGRPLWTHRTRASS